MEGGQLDSTMPRRTTFCVAPLDKLQVRTKWIMSYVDLGQPESGHADASTEGCTFSSNYIHSHRIE